MIRRYGVCRRCRRRIALTHYGWVHWHVDPETKTDCDGSRRRPDRRAGITTDATRELVGRL